jgi:hypothetical protein
MANVPTREAIAAKFRELGTEALGELRTGQALDLLSGIASLRTLDAIPPAFDVAHAPA